MELGSDPGTDCGSQYQQSFDHVSVYELQCFRGPKRCPWSCDLTSVDHNTDAQCCWWLRVWIKKLWKCCKLSALVPSVDCLCPCSKVKIMSEKWRTTDSLLKHRFFVVLDWSCFCSFLHQTFCTASPKDLFLLTR